MLKQFLVLWLLTQRNLISSEQDVNVKAENTRATRQLSFGECCPCPEQDAYRDQEPENSFTDTVSIGDDCPCMKPADSEGASSIFQPAFRAVEPFLRPGSKKEPKPLLNPEVGLASSVLETLREVTDQEYREALVRDAARSALQLFDPEPHETEPKNVINIIVSPKDDNNDDTMSEATEVQRSACVLPPVSMSNNFEPLRLQPPTNLLKHILTPKFPSNSILNRNRFDMDGSASNTLERTATPFKHNILENMKERLSLLNLKPFSNTDNRDYLTPPNILQKHHIKNNIRDLLLSRSKPIFDMQPKSANNHNNIFGKNTVDEKRFEMNQDEIPSLNKGRIMSFSNNVQKLKTSAEGNIDQNINCLEVGKEPKVLSEEHLADFDVIPSSSKVNEVIKENVNALKEDMKENPNAFEKEIDGNQILNEVTNSLNVSPLESVADHNSTPNIAQETPEVVTDDSNILNLHTNESEIENTTKQLENMTDMESEPSISRNVVTSFKDAINPECTSSTQDDNKNIRNAYRDSSGDSEQKPLSSTSDKKDTAEPKTPIIPNLKEDIFRTLESFKQANEKIQEKLRLNVQDALKLVTTDKPHHLPQKIFSQFPSEIHPSSMDSSQNLESPVQNITDENTDKPHHLPPKRFSQFPSEIGPSSMDSSQNLETPVQNITDENTLSTQDLQKMSDSLLERSSLNDDNDALIKPDKEEELRKGLGNKSVEVLKASNINDLTSLNGKNFIINKKEKLELNSKNQQTNDKNDNTENLCNHDIAKSSDSDPSIMHSNKNEMTAEPSNSVFSSIPQQNIRPIDFDLLKKDYIAQPEDNLRPIDGIKDFFNSLNVLNRDIFQNSDKDSTFFENRPTLGFNKVKNLEFLKSFSKESAPKFNSDSSLRSYKAKVASPKSLDINSLHRTPLSTDDDSDVLGFASQTMPQINNIKNVGRNNFETGLNPLFKTIQAPKMFQNTLPSFTPRLAENFNSLKNNAVNTIGDTLGINQELFTLNKNNLLGKPLITPDHVFRTVLRTHEDFNDKIQAFHSDLNRKLSSWSSRTLPDGSRLLQNAQKLRNSKDNTKFSSKNMATPDKWLSATTKNKPLSNSAPRVSNSDILRSSLKEKLGILPQHKDLGSKKVLTGISLPKVRQTTKKLPKSNLKFKPLKENKVTISFATTSIRPDTLISKIKPRLKSESSLARRPKLSTSLQDKKSLKSKLKSIEPKVSASEISRSRAAIPSAVKKLKISQEVTSIEESERSHFEGHDLDDKQETVGISEASRRKKILMSKLQSPFVPRMVNESRRNDKLLSSQQKAKVTDANQSASNNIDTSISATSLIDETLKDKPINQSIKCKMVCIHDMLETIDKR